MKKSAAIDQWNKLETNLAEAIKICNELFQKSDFKGSEEFNKAYEKLMAAHSDFLKFESRNKHTIFAQKK